MEEPINTAKQSPAKRQQAPLDQLGDLAHRIDRTVLQKPVAQRAEPVLPGGGHVGRPRGFGLQKEIAADRAIEREVQREPRCLRLPLGRLVV